MEDKRCVYSLQYFSRKDSQAPDKTDFIHGPCLIEAIEYRPFRTHSVLLRLFLSDNKIEY